MYMAKLLRIHKDNPQPRLLEEVVTALRNGAVVIYPTDTVYALGCDIHNKKAFEQICRIKGVNPEKTNFSCICEDVGIVSDYALQVSTPIYKLLKAALPGPYTFLLNASKNIPKHVQSNKKTIGIRVVNHQIPTQIVRQLGNPILTTSLKDEADDMLEYLTDPELILERYQKLVDIVIDGGYGGLVPSTILDVSGGEGDIKVVREGLGPLEPLNLSIEP